jgi:hypothetical protein
MKLKEVIVEGIGDAIRSGIYRATGYGGNPANQSATKVKFINDLKQKLKLNKDSARRSGVPFDTNKYVDSYLAKYNAKVDDEQRDQLKKLANNPDKFANYMYMLMSQQTTNQQGYVKGSNSPQQYGAGSQQYGAGPQAGGRPQQQTAAAPQLEPTTTNVIKQIQKLTGPERLDDLAEITKSAMKVLYKQNPTKYSDLYKEIMTGKSNANKMNTSSLATDLATKRQQNQKAMQQYVDSTSPYGTKDPVGSSVMGNIANTVQPKDTSVGANAFSAMNKSLGGPETMPPEQNPSDKRSQDFEKAAMTARGGMTDAPAPTDFAAKRELAAKNAQASMKPKVTETRRFYKR